MLASTGLQSKTAPLEIYTNTSTIPVIPIAVTLPTQEFPRPSQTYKFLLLRLRSQGQCVEHVLAYAPKVVRVKFYQAWSQDWCGHCKQ